MKIICIGRNYVDHIRELNHSIPSDPVFFLKPDTALLIRNRPFYYPAFTGNIHYEIELALKICKVGKNIQSKFAGNYYNEIGIGFDMTARDLQENAKQKGLPWTMAKGFDQSAPLGKFLPKSSFPDVTNIPFHLDLNGKTVQIGNSSMMIFSFSEIIVYISRFMTLHTGDIIFTGTPAGVGSVKQGDKLEGFIGDQKLLNCLIK
ncbi:MAG: fumarylacetoacetate hydrolase family protein [Bacteroidales bacterium]|jgi:2-keto-4-pentenoate hydratase/2-oxohepta-3-ene-1,7-dioic acid hydratase in catechol pathway|nr:fumarylacetoacetate hydrolase family protein [Bacteroidales bacterium]